MLSKYYHHFTDEEIAIKLKPIPLRRFIHPDDIAYMVEFLISDKANNITGQNVVIDGGQTILGEENHMAIM
jgi:NAD(P)-dependent dehydrogenase (short-subunit alcohol dehydrogenase family)